MEYIVTSSVGAVQGVNSGMATMTAVPVPVASGATSLPLNGVWYNYPDNVGQLLAAGASAVQLEIGNNTDNIARQFNQQVQAQYGNLQVQVLQHPIIQTKEEPDMITSEIIPAQKAIIAPGTAKMSKPRVRNTNERIPCDLCGKTVSCNATLKDHMRTHTGERPFKCSECGLAFAQRSNLRMHKRLHTGERPYMCGICGKTFARSSHLPAHMRTHTGEKPFVCKQCNHAFITSQQLKNHFRVHTGEKPWKCDMCEAEFTHSSSLSTHKKKHTGEKPYSCEKCNKAFFFTSALDKHMKVHTKDRPFKCQNCDKTFKYKESLTVHSDKYCGKESLRKPRAKRRPDARKPGPKPGSGRKYIQKRKGKVRGRPRKRGRWSKRQVVKRNYKDMDEGTSIDFEELEKSHHVYVKEDEDPLDTQVPDDDPQPIMDQNQENIPVAELKVEVLNSEDGMVRLTEHVDVHEHPSHSHNAHHLQAQMPDGTLVHHQPAHEIRIDNNAGLTIVSAQDPEQVANMNGVQLLTLPTDVPIQLLQANGETLPGQIITRDGVPVWCPRTYP